MEEIDKSKTEPWLAVDPGAEKAQRVPEDDPNGLLVSLRYWPPRVELRLRPRLAGLSIYRPKDAPALDPSNPADAEQMVELNETDLEIYREAARWGVAGWAGNPAPTFTSEVVDGETYKVLAPESLTRLFRNQLLFAVAQHAIAFNVLTEKKSERSAP